MTEFVALPLIVAFAAAFVATSMHRSVQAEVAARVIAGLLLVLSIVAVPTVWLMGSSGLRHVGVRSPFTDWASHLLPSLGPVGAVLGALAFALMMAGTVRTYRVLRLHRRLRVIHSSGVEVLPSPDVFAYTLPGPAGSIVVSEGLVSALNAEERHAVIAHERAHARHRHDRYLLLGRVATALLPFMQPLADRLEFSLERWADDEAARRVGDRRLVATAIARVAAAAAHPSPAVSGIARLGAVGRVEALLSTTGRAALAPPASLVSGLALLTTFIAVVLQLHHTALFGASLLG